MKKTLSLLLALVMILGCLPAALADDGWVTLRVECFDRNAAGFNVEDCMQLRYVQEHFGDPNKIKVEFVSVSRWEETAILNTLLAGQTAPDLCMTYDGSLMQTYIDMGGVYPMDKLLETYGQNVKEFLGEGCLMYGINAEDGVRYNLVARRLNVGMLGVFVRGDWLEQLNMAIPTTRQQWIDYLYAARDAKLGGDITLPYAFGFYEANPLWGNSLLVNSYLDWENITEEQYLVAGSYKEVLPGAKEAYRLLNQFYHDGILNPDYPLDATDDSNNQKFYLGQVGTKIATYDDPYRADQAYQQEMSKNVPGAYWVPANCMTNKDGYTHINHNRKPEVMNTGVYHPTHYGETKALIAKAKCIIKLADRLLEQCPAAALPAFWELVYYPAAASANHCLLWLCTGLNEFYARQGRCEANHYADLMQSCLLRDRSLAERYHAIGNGRFYGFALSEHIGFVTWCEDGNRMPITMRVEGANKPRLIVADSAGERFTIGSRWTGDTLTLPYALHPGVNEVQVDLACGSREPVCYTVETDCPWLTLSHHHGCVTSKDVLTIRIDRAKLTGMQTGVVTIRAGMTSRIRVLAQNAPEDADGLYLESSGLICIEADHFAEKHDAPDAAWTMLRPYGRTESAVKVLPPVMDCCGLSDRPWLEYRFFAAQDGDYLLHLYMGPSNTATMEHRLCFGLQMNGGEVREINGAGEGFRSLDLSCREWDHNVRSNIRIRTVSVTCRKGSNTLRLYGGSPLVVFERLVLHPADVTPQASYLGPRESYIQRSNPHD